MFLSPTMGLGNDVLIHMFTFLDVTSLGRVAQTCTVWKSLSSADRIWNGLGIVERGGRAAVRRELKTVDVLVTIVERNCSGKPEDPLRDLRECEIARKISTRMKNDKPISKSRFFKDAYIIMDDPSPEAVRLFYSEIKPTLKCTDSWCVGWDSECQFQGTLRIRKSRLRRLLQNTTV